MIKTQVKVDLKPLEKLKKGAKPIVRKAVTETAKEVVLPVAKAKASAVKRYGFLEKSLSTRIKSFKTAVAAVVGPRSKYVRVKGVRKKGKNKGERIRHRPSFYMHLVDRGGKRIQAKRVMTDTMSQTKHAFGNRVTVRVKELLAEKSG